MSMEVPPGAETDLPSLLRECEVRIGYRFQDKEFFAHPDWHASGEAHRLASNERLEFLGDAILGAVVSNSSSGSIPNFLKAI